MDDQLETAGSLTGKHALVTGGGSGIGLAIARALLRAGAAVSVVSRSVHEREADARFFRAKADVANEEEVRRAFAECREANGPIAILVNNSGIAESAPFTRTDRALWDRTIGTNLTGTYRCTREVVTEMLDAKWGRIVNIASIAGLAGAPYISAYVASKHGVVGLTRALAAEFAESGVTVNAVCPGYTDTEMVGAAVRNIVAKTGIAEQQARAQLAQTNSSGRMVMPEEVADAVLLLCLGIANGSEVVLPAVGPQRP